MLDGLDSDKFLKQFNLDQTNLWPHQKKAIAQGLSILREQGSVLVADSTGSGKTRTGLWLMAAADTMIKNSQENSPLNPDPILVVPSSVQKEWRREVRRELRRTPDVIGHGQISHNYKENTEGAEILDRLTDTTVVLVDEAHNFYNDKSNRTMKLRAHGAQSSVLLTATPINRSFDDLLSLIELLSQDEFDEDLELRRYKLRIKKYIQKTKTRDDTQDFQQPVLFKTSLYGEPDSILIESQLLIQMSTFNRAGLILVFRIGKKPIIKSNLAKKMKHS